MIEKTSHAEAGRMPAQLEYDLLKEFMSVGHRKARDARRRRAIAFFKAAGHLVSVATSGAVLIFLLDAAKVPAPSAFVVGLVLAADVLLSEGAWWVWTGKTFGSYLDDI